MRLRPQCIHDTIKMHKVLSGSHLRNYSPRGLVILTMNDVAQALTILYKSDRGFITTGLNPQENHGRSLSLILALRYTYQDIASIITTVSTSLEMQSRSLELTRGQLNQLRREGWIPAIVYGGEKGPEAISINRKQWAKELESPGIKTRVFKLADNTAVLVRDMQFPPTKDVPIHLDFLRLGETVVVSVPVRFINEDKSPGLRRGGVLNVIHYTLSVSVPSSNIPQDLSADLTGVDIGQTIHLQDMKIPGHVKVLHVHENEGIVSIVAPSGLESSEAAASTEA